MAMVILNAVHARRALGFATAIAAGVAVQTCWAQADATTPGTPGAPPPAVVNPAMPTPNDGYGGSTPPGVDSGMTNPNGTNPGVDRYPTNREGTATEPGVNSGQPMNANPAEGSGGMAPGGSTGTGGTTGTLGGTPSPGINSGNSMGGGSAMGTGGAGSGGGAGGAGGAGGGGMR